MIGEYIFAGIIGIVSVYGLITRYLEYDKEVRREARNMRAMRETVER